MSLQFSEELRTLARRAEETLKEQFARIDAVAEVNTLRVLDAFR